MYKSQAGVRLPWKAGVGVGPVLSVGCHPHHHSWAQELGSGAMQQGDDWQERGERGKQRGRLAQGPWLRVVGAGVSSTDWAKALGPPWPHWMLVVPPQGARQRGSGSVRAFIGHTPGLGLGWGLSSQVVRRMETLGESSAQGKYRVLGCPGGQLGSSRLHKGFLEAANA